MTSRDVPAKQVDRHPLARIAAEAARIRAAVVGVVAVLAGAGIVSDRLPGALDVLLAAVIALAAAVGPVWTAFAMRNRGEQVVTPLVDPRDDDGVQLVRSDGRPLMADVDATPIR